MEKLFMITAIILQGINICLFCLKWGAKGSYLLFEWSWKSINRMQRILYLKIYYRQKKKKWKAKILQQAGTIKTVKIIMNKKGSIVGESKTEFIQELPKLNYPEPFKSIPLESEAVIEYIEEPDIDPDDVIVEIPGNKVKEMLMADDPEMFSHERDYPSDISSGVTFEQLTDTYNTLINTNPKIEEENAAFNILMEIEGSEFFNFFMLHSQCTLKAKLLLAEKENTNQELSEFDMDKYI